MAQLHCYVTDELAKRLKAKAEQSHQSVSKYLAELIRREVDAQWPADYFDQVFGCWEGEPLERADQGEYEQRREFD